MTNVDYEALAVRELLSSSNQVIAVIDRETMVRWISPSAALYDLAPVGQSIIELIHPEDLERATQAFDGAIDDPQFRPSLMANAIVPLRIVTNRGPVPFEVSGRWASDDQGREWMIAILHEVSTRAATDAVLRQLAEGSDEMSSIDAVLGAARTFGGVTHAQVIWTRGRASATAGDFGSDVAAMNDRFGDFTDLKAPGVEIEGENSDWGQAMPILAGTHRVGTVLVLGVGMAPSPSFVAGVMSPLLSIAALAIRRSQELAQLEMQATTDEVTGLLNRYSFFEELDAFEGPGGLMFVDLDAFKSVNDRFGHGVGDQLLQLVGRRLQEIVKQNDTVSRIGGDEFVVLCPGASLDDMRMAGEAVVAALNQSFWIQEFTVDCGASVGSAHTSGAVPGRVLLAEADRVLLDAKAEGKGRALLALVKPAV